MFQSTCNIKWN